jgi:hypothetical protein
MGKTSLLIAALVGACGGTASSESTGPGDAAVALDVGADGARTADADTAGALDFGADGAGPADATASPDAARSLHGGVFVEFVPETHTSFLAIFFDRPLTELAPLEIKEEQAGCRLMVPRQAGCMPACAQDSICTGINTCSPRRNPVDVGVLHVEGLAGMSHDVEPTSPTVLIYQIVTTLPYAACKEGEDVTVSAKDFSLASKCISPLTVTSTAPIPVTSGQPMRLAWTPPGRLGITRIQLELEISHHGGFKGQIECDVPDTGSFDVPAPLITSLVTLGRAGYPTVKVTRTSMAPASTQPQVTLTMRSQAELIVDAGVISCGAASSPPCPTGTTCRLDFTCGP